MTSMPEHVLCSRTADLPQQWLGDACCVPLDWKELLDGISAYLPIWLPRPAAELDETHKQWIPYVLLHDNAERLAVYPRQGTEARLHGLWSLGIGGHINPIDEPPEESDGATRWKKLIETGMRRELKEEYPAAAVGSTKLLGIIHENQTSVGRVHLGAVFMHTVGVTAAQPSGELRGLEWVRISALGESERLHDRLELWSRLALDLFHRTSAQ